MSSTPKRNKNKLVYIFVKNKIILQFETKQKKVFINL